MLLKNLNQVPIMWASNRANYRVSLSWQLSLSSCRGVRFRIPGLVPSAFEIENAVPWVYNLIGFRL